MLNLLKSIFDFISWTENIVNRKDYDFMTFLPVLGR